MDSAVDVAKEAADIVLLRHDLDALAQGVRNGRLPFANTLKFMVLRTRRPFFKSNPGRILLAATLVVAGATIVLPYTSLSAMFGLVPLPLHYMLALIAITILYLLASEAVKHRLFAHLERN